MTVLFTALLSEGSIIDLDGTFFVQLGLFALAFLLFRPLFFRPMLALFEAREQAIEGARVEAMELQDLAKGAGKEFEDEMRRLRVQAGEERERLRAQGKHLERTLLDRVRDETTRELAAADAKLKTEAARLRQEIQQSVPTLARDIASKLLQQEVR